MKLRLGRPTFIAGATRGQHAATMVRRVRLDAGQAASFDPASLKAAFSRWLRAYGGGEGWNGFPHLWIKPRDGDDGPVRAGPLLWTAALTAGLLWLARDTFGHAEVQRQPGGKAGLIFVPWRRRPVAAQASVWAARWVEHWWTDPDQEAPFADAFAAWLERVRTGGLTPSTMRYVRSAVLRRIPVAPLGGNVVRFGWGCRQVRLDGSFTDQTGVIAAAMARNKVAASALLRLAGLPVPRSVAVRSLKQADIAAEALGWPVVVKPAALDQGVGVVSRIRSSTELHAAVKSAVSLGRRGAIVEEFVPGNDYRLLIVAGGKVRAAAWRIPAGVTGDGRRSVQELVAEANADPRRGSSKSSMLIALDLNAEAERMLAGQGLEPRSVPAAGRFVRLSGTANISTGGTARDVTAQVHPDNWALAERAARVVGLDIAGVDFLCPDISRPWHEIGGKIIEVNGQPGLRVHWLADPGRDINGEILEQVTGGGSLRIPTAAITGTNGKTTTALLLQRMWMRAGRVTGVCTTHGTWIDGQRVSRDNLSGLPGAQALLADPSVEAVVVEMPRKALKMFGHPCDQYSVAALLNIQDDHLGEMGVETLADMARLKGGVLQRAQAAIVVNADDPLCVEVAARATCSRRIWVSLTSGGADGDERAFVDEIDGEPWLVLTRDGRTTPLVRAADVGVSNGGAGRHNLANALFAAAMAQALDVPQAAIQAVLTEFCNTPDSNPGRANILPGHPCPVILDYAHNPDGVRAICAQLAHRPVRGQRMIVAANIGNRHRAHLDACALELAASFDRFILSCDPARVGANPAFSGADPAGALLTHFRSALLSHGVSPQAITTNPDPAAAIRYALGEIGADDLLLVLAEPSVALPVIQGKGG